MTPDELAAIEARAREYTDLYPPAEWIMTAVGEMLILCAALREAWAERDDLDRILREMKNMATIARIMEEKRRTLWEYFEETDTPRTRPGLKTLEDTDPR